MASVTDKIIRRLFKYGIRSRKLAERLEIAYWKEAEIEPWRLDPNLPLQPELAELLPEKRRVLILDVGCGLATTVGKKHEGKKINIVAIDPLADKYWEIIYNRELILPVFPVNLSLSDFHTTKFDIVHARNSIDHSENPVKLIEQMVRVCRGWVYMEHYENTAEREGYMGMHQWNFTVVGGELLIWNKKKEYFTQYPSVRKDGKIITKIDCTKLAQKSLLTDIMESDEKDGLYE